MRYFLDSIEGSNIVQCVYAGRKSSMKAEYLIVYQRGEGQVVEQISEIFPDVCVTVFSETLVVEPIDLGNLARFVIAS